ncbi:hypothetical protein Tco_0250880 [Tanacetum coccineum]
MGYNMKTLHSKVKTLDRQMYDRYNNEFRLVKKFDQSDKRIHEQLPEGIRFRELHHGLSDESAHVPRLDNPYVMARDAVAAIPTREDDDDPTIPSDP